MTLPPVARSEWLARAGVQFNVPEIYPIDDRRPPPEK
jgi:hypothetical protein